MKQSSSHLHSLSLRVCLCAALLLPFSFLQSALAQDDEEELFENDETVEFNNLNEAAENVEENDINFADENETGFDNSSLNDVEFNNTAFEDPFENVGESNSAGNSGSDFGGGQENASQYDSQLREFNSSLKRSLRHRFESDLRRYCFQYCSLLSFDVQSSEVFDAVNPSLGFENTATEDRTFNAERVTADILIDVRYGERNTERLKKVLENVIKTYSYPIALTWTQIELPATDSSAKSVAAVKQEFTTRIRSELDRVVRDFCPDECQISDIQVQVEQASIDEISDGSLNRYIFARGARGSSYVKGVTASLSINSEMDPSRQDRIESLIREVLQPFGSVNLSLRRLSFPRSAAEIRRDRQAEREDPYGLEKLRQMLQIFKEFAGTKEIIRETTTDSRSESSLSESSLKESTRDSSLTSETSSSLAEKLNAKETGPLGLTQEMLYVIGGILLLVVIAGALGLRFVMAGKRMQQVVGEGMGVPHTVGIAGVPAPAGGGAAVGGPVSLAAAQGQSVNHDELVRSLEIQKIKDELIQTFLRQPKVAREVFGRILKEEGVQQAAKCVSIFGEIVTFELIDDNDLQDGLATLAEYVHKNVPQVESEEELKMLQSLKLRVAAGKIKVMSSKGTGSFEFLQSKTANQIYNLIADENPESQSIVLTQLPKSKRNTVFELFEGESKVGLLRALCQGRTVATEYIMSLADALRRKAQRSGILDQGAMSGVDVLLDLLGQASLNEQQNLMAELDSTNPEAARMVRGSLVTPETLQFIRDGLLIEVFLGLEADTLATFLGGCPEHLRNLVLSKVPQDLAEDWYELIRGLHSIDSENYKIAEMQILTKIRSYSDSGMINLLEINRSLFPVQNLSTVVDSRSSRRKSFKISQSIVA